MGQRCLQLPRSGLFRNSATHRIRLQVCSRSKINFLCFVVLTVSRNFRSGRTYTTYTFESAAALPILYEMLKKKGAKLIRKKVESLHDVSGYDYIFNCTGCGAAGLVDDRSLEPVSGHVLRVSAPWLNQAMIMETGDDYNPIYLIPK